MPSFIGVAGSNEITTKLKVGHRYWPGWVGDPLGLCGRWSCINF